MSEPLLGRGPEGLELLATAEELGMKSRHQGGFVRALQIGGLATALSLATQAVAACPGPMRFGLADPLTGPSAIFGIDQIRA